MNPAHLPRVLEGNVQGNSGPREEFWKLRRSSFRSRCMQLGAIEDGTYATADDQWTRRDLKLQKTWRVMR